MHCSLFWENCGVPVQADGRGLPPLGWSLVWHLNLLLFLTMDCSPSSPSYLGLLFRLGFELRVSQLLDRLSITWAIPPSLFALVFLCLTFYPGLWPGPQSSYSRTSTIAGMPGACPMPSYWLRRGLTNSLARAVFELWSFQSQPPK
jgi:hypothetical protein